MIDILKEQWPWYIAGPLISIAMFMLLFFGKGFGLSSNLRTICAIGGAGRFSEFFRFDWKEQSWNLLVLLGIVIGGFISNEFLTSDSSIDLNPEIIVELNEYGIESAGKAMLPNEIFGLESVFSIKGFIMLVIGGVLVGFGTRWAGGCTSGHAISGLSNLQLPSLIAVIGFFIGGLIMTYFFLPSILSL